MIWEIGYLPLPRMLNPRFANALWRRRAELLDAASPSRHRLALERLSTGFASEETRAA